ncbi:MAG: hypothetical protein GTN86_02215 [Xanthomonadales bacterium]|nr:hypothetical protein [Xanthomonadales bacterium]NIN58828.1 hypothetical protein [Xanthomonadales bacterium]NIN74096.1 hypothetical protein [Xanthomonadales bacterium]NIO14629.1 hypothetical protein [Xanthomonadales bacterium]NIP11221.1 hypothetical protein [Xanthomonadales bacterium]
MADPGHREILRTGLAPHPAFNHNDLFHVIQILGNFMFYLCARDTLAPADAP